jgi:SAM-dependent methyltransferase
VEKSTRSSDLESLLAGQADYYRERAAEYDDWWLRRGRYDRGPEANARWFAEISTVEAALNRFGPAGDVLELACGTGQWTRRLVPYARRVTALDLSPEVLEINRARLDSATVEYVEADLFAWEPDRAYDVCVFSFWISHVPEERFRAFWEKVKRALAPDGRVFFIDNMRSKLASAVDHKLPDPGEQVARRRLADGREFYIVKRFYEPRALQRRLADLGWSAQIQTSPEFFIYGRAIPTA